MLCSELIFILHYYSKETRKSLYTCAIRPAAIYGPGEERHFPRIIKFAKLGLIPFKIGSTNVKTDWVYVDNLVLALLLASIGLLDDIPGQEGPPVAAGQAYFISDGNWSLPYIFFVYTLKFRLIVSIVYCFYSRDLFETSNLQNARQHALNLSNSYLHYLTLSLFLICRVSHQQFWVSLPFTQKPGLWTTNYITSCPSSSSTGKLLLGFILYHVSLAKLQVASSTLHTSCWGLQGLCLSPLPLFFNPFAVYLLCALPA